MAQHGTAWHSMAQHGTAWHSMAQHGTAWHSMALHCTAATEHITLEQHAAITQRQHSTAQDSTVLWRTTHALPHQTRAKRRGNFTRRSRSAVPPPVRPACGGWRRGGPETWRLAPSGWSAGWTGRWRRGPQPPQPPGCVPPATPAHGRTHPPTHSNSNTHADRTCIAEFIQSHRTTCSKSKSGQSKTPQPYKAAEIATRTTPTAGKRLAKVVAAR
jgi:hypothetical protein